MIIMVTVRKLISELKKVPQHLQVGVAMHDNSDHEVAGWVISIIEDTDNDMETHETGKKCVVLRC